MAELNKRDDRDARRAQVKAFLTANHLTQLWITAEIRRLFGLVIDPSSVSFALTGRRTGERSDEILEMAEKVVWLYERKYLGG